MVVGGSQSYEEKRKVQSCERWQPAVVPSRLSYSSVIMCFFFFFYNQNLIFCPLAH